MKVTGHGLTGPVCAGPGRGLAPRQPRLPLCYQGVKTRRFQVSARPHRLPKRGQGCLSGHEVPPEHSKQNVGVKVGIIECSCPKPKSTLAYSGALCAQQIRATLNVVRPNKKTPGETPAPGTGRSVLEAHAWADPTSPSLSPLLPSLLQAQLAPTATPPAGLLKPPGSCLTALVLCLASGLTAQGRTVSRRGQRVTVCVLAAGSHDRHSAHEGAHPVRTPSLAKACHSFLKPQQLPGGRSPHCYPSPSTRRT